MVKKIKWVGTLSTTERNNIGLIQVRQNNVNSEVLGFNIVDGNGEPYDLKDRKVLFCTYFDRFAPVEQYAEVIEDGKIVYTMNEHDMQKPVRINFAYFKIMDDKDILVDTTQNFSYDILPSIESKCMNSEPYIIRLEEVLDAFLQINTDAKKELEQIIIDFNQQIIEQQQNFDIWFESIREILESVDPGGVILNEIVDFRYSKMIDKHFQRIKDRGDFWDDEFQSRGINVSWFGAKGDGITDDTKAIQKAIDSELSNYILFDRNKIYKISDSIKMSIQNAVLDLNNSHLIQATPTSRIIEIVNGIGLSVRNGKLSYETLENVESIYKGAITLVASSHCTIENMEIVNYESCGIGLFAAAPNSCDNNIIRNNIINCSTENISRPEDASGILLGYSGTNYFNNHNIIEFNNIEGNRLTGHGVALIGHNTNNIIAGNNIKNVIDYGIVVYESDVVNDTVFGNHVTRNTVENVGYNKTKKGMGIYMLCSHRSTIESNIVKNILQDVSDDFTLVRGGIAMSGCSYVKCSNNIVDGSMRYGIGTGRSTDISIVNNTVINVKNHGVWLSQPKTIIVDGNNIQSEQSAVYILSGDKIQDGLEASYGRSGVNVKVLNNKLDSGSSPGVWALSVDPSKADWCPKNITIRDNTITSKAQGIRVDKAEDCIVSDNNVLSTAMTDLSGLLIVTGVTDTAYSVISNNIVESLNYKPQIGIIATGNTTGLSSNIVKESSLFALYNNTPITQYSHLITTNSDAIPTKGIWNRGDIIFNSAPRKERAVGWICTVSGSPGEWEPIATII